MPLCRCVRSMLMFHGRLLEPEYVTMLNSVPYPRVKAFMATTALTIGRLARAAGVGIETVRYYQRRGLLSVPSPVGTFRHYTPETIDRIRFIKRAQELGFTLTEVQELLRLNDGADRSSIRKIAQARLEQIDTNLSDLRRMQRTLKHVIHECEHTKADLPCPIIETLTADTKPLN